MEEGWWTRSRLKGGGEKEVEGGDGLGDLRGQVG
jgi:hypothetical protein